MRPIYIVRILSWIVLIASIAWFFWPRFGPPRLIDKFPSDAEMLEITVADLGGGLAAVVLLIDALIVLTKRARKRVARKQE